MSDYDYARRLKQLIRREKALTRREGAIAKSIHKFRDDLEKAEQRYHSQCKESEQLRKQLQEQQEYVQKQDQLQNEAEARLEEVRKKQQFAQELVSQELSKQNLFLEQLYKIRYLKEVTNTFINLNVLSAGLVQGVVLKETPNNSEWKPFQLNLMQHTPEQLKAHIWGESPQDDDCSNAWEELVFSGLRNTLK